MYLYDTAVVTCFQMGYFLPRKLQGRIGPLFDHFVSTVTVATILTVTFGVLVAVTPDCFSQNGAITLAVHL